MKLLDEKEIEDAAHKYSPENGRVQMAYFVGAKYAEQQLLLVTVEFAQYCRGFQKENMTTEELFEQFSEQRTMKQI